MKKSHVLVLMNDYLAPPTSINESDIDRDKSPWIMQYDVINSVKNLDYNVSSVALDQNINTLKSSLETHSPDIVFNLLVEFGGEAIFDQNVISYLELLQIPFTGCNPRSLMLARNKAITKKILHYHGIPTANFHVFPKNQAIIKPAHLKFPAIVKCLCEDGSLGISKASLVYSEDKLIERVAFLHESYRSDAIVERFIEGRELYVGILGDKRLTSFPVWELIFAKSTTPEEEFYHAHAKWNDAYRLRKGIHSQQAELPASVVEHITSLAKQTYRALGLNGYARIDFRMTNAGEIYIIEANPNPDLSSTEDFAMSAQANGMPYATLLKRIIALGLSHSR